MSTPTNFVPDTDEEWEAELEGELNEFEVVSSKEGSPQNQVSAF